MPTCCVLIPQSHDEYVAWRDRHAGWVITFHHISRHGSYGILHSAAHVPE
jgi:hypothetical protein